MGTIKGKANAVVSSLLFFGFDFLFEYGIVAITS